MSQYEWDYCHIHQALAEQLLWCLIEEQQNAVITYKELCDRAGNVIAPRPSAPYLGDLSYWCVEAGMPMISSMVVSQETGMPGPGFYPFYRTTYGSDEQDKFKIFKDELKKVREYKEWYRLAELLDLDEELIKELKPKQKMEFRFSPTKMKSIR